MAIKIEADAGIVRVTGEMTVYAAREFKQPLLDALAEGPASIQLDLSGVSEFDTAGLQLLVLARRELLAKGRSLRLAATSEIVREALTLCGALEPLVDAAPARSRP